MEENNEVMERKQKEPINISYKKLWHLLVEKDLKITQLGELAGISTATLSKLKKEENITTETISKICKALNCDVKDIMQYKGAIPKEDNPEAEQ